MSESNHATTPIASPPNASPRRGVPACSPNTALKSMPSRNAQKASLVLDGKQIGQRRATGVDERNRPPLTPVTSSVGFRLGGMHGLGRGALRLQPLGWIWPLYSGTCLASASALAQAQPNGERSTLSPAIAAAAPTTTQGENNGTTPFAAQSNHPGAADRVGPTAPRPGCRTATTTEREGTSVEEVSDLSHPA